jgi:hypothetical protein
MYKRRKRHRGNTCDYCVDSNEIALAIVLPKDNEAKEYHGYSIRRRAKDAEDYLAFPKADHAKRMVALFTARQGILRIAKQIGYKAKKQEHRQHRKDIGRKLTSKGRLCVLHVRRRAFLRRLS